MRIVRTFARLRWRLVRGALRAPGSQKWATALGLIAAVAAGSVIGLLMFLAGQTSVEADQIVVLGLTGVAAGVLSLGVIAGVTQPVDPRIIATEPLTDRQLAAGLLVTSAAGPPGMAAGLIGLGVYAGGLRDAATIAPVALATGAFLATLLLVSRTTVNVLGLFATRFPRAGQLVAGLGALIFYGAFQFVPSAVASMESDDRRALADAVAWSPPGQLGRAIAVADESVLRSLGHLAGGAAWLVPLAWAFAWTTRRLIVAVPRTAARASRRSMRAALATGVSTGEIAGDISLGPHGASSAPGAVGRLFRHACGKGPTGALAWRGLLTRIRTPRTALETFTGAGVGMAIVLVPALTQDAPGAGAVLVGGAVQLAVLFSSGNTFGSDGPAIGAELLCGTGAATVVRGKVRSIAVAGAPIAIVGPLVAAGVTGEWAYLPAGYLVAAGGLLGGTAGAIVQSTLVPVAIPEGDNPLASGDTGRGCLAGVILGAVLVSLAIVTLPVALALLWAIDRGSLPLVTALSAVTLAAGALVLHLAQRYAIGRWRVGEAEIFAAITPAR